MNVIRVRVTSATLDADDVLPVILEAFYGLDATIEIATTEEGDGD